MKKIMQYIGHQFGKPTGLGGKVATWLMNRINKKLYKAVKENLRSEPDNTVLDIGFGNGFLVGKLAKQLNGLFYGIDISEDMLQVAVKKNQKLIHSNKLALQCAQVEKLPFPDDFFTFIYTINTVYFWTDLQTGLYEIARVLQPGGQFIHVFYTKEWIEKWKYTTYGFSKYTLLEIQEKSLQCGFSKVSILESSNAFHTMIALKEN